MALAYTLQALSRSPLTQDRPWEAFARFAGWQLRSRLSRGPHVVPFAGRSRLAVSRGMTGATGNIYLGLHEFRSMALTLHLLRPGDLFADVGANVGSFTILAAEAGADCIAFEPHPASMEALRRNVRLNGFERRVETVCACVGAKPGDTYISADEGPNNHVSEQGLKSRVVTLDDEISRPLTLIKIDVEGFEEQVIDGGLKTLASTLAASVEIGNALLDYGSSVEVVHRRMLALGFSCVSYDPFGRRIFEIEGPQYDESNAIYVRDIDQVQQRVLTAPPYRILGRDL